MKKPLSKQRRWKFFCLLKQIYSCQRLTSKSRKNPDKSHNFWTVQNFQKKTRNSRLKDVRFLPGKRIKMELLHQIEQRFSSWMLHLLVFLARKNFRGQFQANTDFGGYYCRSDGNDDFLDVASFEVKLAVEIVRDPLQQIQQDVHGAGVSVVGLQASPQQIHRVAGKRHLLLLVQYVLEELHYHGQTRIGRQRLVELHCNVRFRAHHSSQKHFWNFCPQLFFSSLRPSSYSSAVRLCAPKHTRHKCIRILLTTEENVRR